MKLTKLQQLALARVLIDPTKAGTLAIYQLERVGLVRFDYAASVYRLTERGRAELIAMLEGLLAGDSPEDMQVA